MQCEICGTPLDRPGQGHFCRTGRAPVKPGTETFLLASRRVLRAAVTFAVLIAVVNGLGLAGFSALRSGAADPTELGTQATFLIGGMVAGLVSLVCIVVLLISTVVWIVSAHKMSATGPGVAGYAALTVTMMLIILSYVVPPFLPTLTARTATELAMRLVAVAALYTGVVLVRTRVRNETGTPVPVEKPSLVKSEDWDASTWDPEVQQDIERNRKQHD